MHANYKVIVTQNNLCIYNCLLFGNSENQLKIKGNHFATVLNSHIFGRYNIFKNFQHTRNFYGNGARTSIKPYHSLHNLRSLIYTHMYVGLISSYALCVSELAGIKLLSLVRFCLRITTASTLHNGRPRMCTMD